MKKCVNCNFIIQDNDKYCRKCGCKLVRNSYYIIINIMMVIVSLLLVLLVLMFISSYLI